MFKRAALHCGSLEKWNSRLTSPSTRGRRGHARLSTRPRNSCFQIPAQTDSARTSTRGRPVMPRACPGCFDDTTITAMKQTWLSRPVIHASPCTRGHELADMGSMFQGGCDQQSGNCNMYMCTFHSTSPWTRGRWDRSRALLRCSRTRKDSTKTSTRGGQGTSMRLGAASGVNAKACFRAQSCSMSLELVADGVRRGNNKHVLRCKGHQPNSVHV